MTAGTWNRAAYDEAVKQAEKSLAEGGEPVGAALEIGGELVAVGHNRINQDNDPTAHAEIDVLRRAGVQASYADAVLYTTASPCAMCSGAIRQLGVPVVVIGGPVPATGPLDQLRERGVTIIGLDDPRSPALLEQYHQRTQG